MEDGTAGLVSNVSVQYDNDVCHDSVAFYCELAISGPDFLLNLPAGTLYGLYSPAVSDQSLSEMAVR
ncbi:hypothetical protein [Spirosoma profusum]|uniref:hypothetical protein n=1 Tax=Spirosoma profusum TaxID=2771354 RepID=UPI001687A800|nr:hypothetical protein [Spirosoma profusum]